MDIISQCGKTYAIDILIGVAEWGGVENVVAMTAAFLSRQGHTVRVVQLVWEGVYWLAEDIPFYPLLNGKEGHTLADLSEAYQSFLASETGRKHLPDAVLACGWPYMTYIAKNTEVNLSLDYIVVSWLHAPAERYVSAGYGGYDALRFADAHFAISAQIAHELSAHLPEANVLSVHNPVDFSHLDAKKAEEKGASQPTNLYYVGRLAPEKRIDVMLRALSMADTKYRLVLIGSGSEHEEQQLRNLVRELQLEDRVRFAGHRERPWDEVKDAAALLLASEYEGFGLVIVEALACGIPVISTPVGIAPEIIKPGKNGYLFPAGDAEALAKILAMMYAGLFPAIRQNDCIHAAAIYEKETALRDFTKKLEALICNK